MKDSKSIFFYVAPYLTFCGALYHITFWDKYNINGLSFISVSDIFKAAVYPIFSFLLVVIYNLMIQHLILPSTTDKSSRPILKKRIGNFTLFGIYLFFTFLAAFIFYITKTFNKPYNFIIYGLVNAIFLSILLVNNDFLVGQFTSERVRRLVIDLIVFLPIVSYYTGRYNSEEIYQNLKYKYSVTTITNPTTNLSESSDTLKFIGKTENHFVFTDLKNVKIVFVKSDVIDTLAFFQK